MGDFNMVKLSNRSAATADLKGSQMALGPKPPWYGDEAVAKVTI